MAFIMTVCVDLKYLSFQTLISKQLTIIEIFKWTVSHDDSELLKTSKMKPCGNPITALQIFKAKIYKFLFEKVYIMKWCSSEFILPIKCRSFMSS